PLAPFLQDDLHLKHVQIGMLNSVFFLGAFFLSIPMGWLVDRIGVYWTMAAGQLILGSFILAISLAHSYTMICAYLLLAGMGHATINPSTGKAVMDWFPIKGRATAMGAKQTGLPVGGALAAATLPALALAFGWRKAFVISGAVSMLSVLPCLLFYREPDQKKQLNNGEPINLRTLGEMFKDRNLVLLSCLMMIFVSLQSSLETYLLLFCKDSLMYPVVTAGYFLSLAHLGGVVGRLGWGPMSDFFFRARRKVVLMIIGSLSSALCLLFLFLSPRFPFWCVGVLVFVLGTCAIGWNGIYLTLVAELAGRGREGMAIGTSLTIVFIGVLFGPPLFGYIVDTTGSYDDAWIIFSLMMVVATVPIGFIRELKE
ncbi:MAG: MFS transporter, partial [Pseudomonadota bacterium]